MFHNDLSDRWHTFSLFEQMANIGAEVGRTFVWKKKQNEKMWKNAMYRALELFDLTVADENNKSSLKEICRAREVFLDHALGDNQYSSTPEGWDKYFLPFNKAARKPHLCYNNHI